MLAQIHGHWFELTPIPEPVGELTADVEDDRVVVRKGGKKVDFGPIYHHWGQKGAVCPITGQITSKYGRVRVVLGENSWTLPLNQTVAA